MRNEAVAMRLARLFTLLCACLLLAATSAVGGTQAAPLFKVLAFYNGTYDQAHISFVKEANQWFPQTAAQYNFSYESTNNWDRLNSIDPAQYQVVLFLDDSPHGAAQQAGFQRYVSNGGGWFGFHVAAYADNANDWPWYHNQFLGSGLFHSNTWGPTTAVLRVEDQTHPATKRLPGTFTSAVSEWYSWSNDLRTNPNIRILASVDPSSFPLGTDPNQSWYSGYYPILWTNKNYKMLYANFGHNAMDYPTDTTLSHTFSSEVQNRFVIDGLLWLGGASGNPTPPTDPINTGSWYGLANKGNGKCVDARSAASANGTAIQQYGCNSSNAQQFQLQTTSGGYYRVNTRLNSAQSLDVTGVSTADNAPIQLWSHTGGANQQWQPVAESGGYYHLVNRNGGKCLAVPGASAADSVQLVQLACDGGAAQSFKLTAV
ncbi:ThuA domain-containing protein [Kutzneria albida]|nr:ThuA domain-containing protein [Kutzneria albida]